MTNNKGVRSFTLPNTWEKEEDANKSTVESLADLTSIVPVADNFNFGNTKAENTLLKEPIQLMLNLSKEQGANIDVSSRRSTEPVYVNMIVDAGDNVILPEGYEYSLSQATLIASIGSNYDRIRKEQENRLASGIIITLEQLAGFRDGEDETKLNDETKKELLSDIETLSSIRITIKADEHRRYNEANKRKSQNIQADYTGNMLYTELLTVDGQTYIHIMRKPILYEYAIDAGQVIKYNRHNLDLKHVYELDNAGVVVDKAKTGVKVMNQQRRAIRDFVLRQIGMLRGMNRKKQDIKYETLYSALSKDKAFTGDLSKRSTKSSINNNVTIVLDELKEKGVIKKWDYEGQGRKRYYSFYIVIDPTEKV